METKEKNSLLWLEKTIKSISVGRASTSRYKELILKLIEEAKEMESNLIEQLETKIEDLTAENQSYERELNEKLINENHAFHFYRMGKYGGDVCFDIHYKEYLNEMKKI